MLDVVYMTVVISYCVQCFLLIFYVEGLAEKVRERKYSLVRAMKVSTVLGGMKLKCANNEIAEINSQF